MRRFVLKIALAMNLLLGGLVLPSFAGADHVDYTAAVLAEAKSSGKPYLLDFYATWCTTCRAQDAMIKRLQTENAKYDAITIIRVDWDDAASRPLINANKVARRSTLILFKGENEIDRVVAKTSKSDISGLLDKGF